MKSALGVMLLLAFTPLHAVLAGERVASDESTQIVRELRNSQAEIDEAAAVIKSRKDLVRHLSTAKDSPINKLPLDVRSRFVESLVFTEHGLASYSYLGLNRASVSDLYRIFALFGQQRFIAEIPGLTPKNSAEESMLFMSTMGKDDPTDQEPLPNASCIVDGTGDTHCEYHYGSACNAKCA